MPDAYLLSESDRKAIQSLLDENKSRRFNTANRPRTDNLDTEGIAPEVYVAYTPPAGIPALSESVGTGTPVGTGTGTSIDLDLVPGSNTCNIYRLLPDGLAEISGLRKVVNNLSNAAIDGNSWIVVVRDKFGTWYTTTGTGVGSGELWAILTDKGDGSPSPFSWYEVIETDTILAIPDAPAVSSSSSGGSIASGTYNVVVTYKNSLGREGRASPATPIVVTGPTGRIIVTSPSSSTGAISWNLYITFISSETGDTEPTLQTLPIAIGTNHTSSTLSSTGDLPPGIFSTGGSRSGTFTVLPAYPANDPSTVTLGAIVRLIPSSTGEYYLFEDPETLISGQNILATDFSVPHLSGSSFIEGGTYVLNLKVLLPSKGIYLIQGDLSFDYFTDDEVFYPWIVEMWLTDPDIIQSTRRRLSIPGVTDGNLFFTDAWWFTLPTHFLYTAEVPTIIGMTFKVSINSNITMFNVNGGGAPLVPHSSLHWVRLSTKTDDITQPFPFHLAQSKPISKALIDPYKTNTSLSIEPSSVRASDTRYPPTMQKNKYTTSKARDDKTEPLTKHLLYHIHPVSGTGVWQQNVRSLLRRIELFNGHRVVAITTGRGESNRGEVLDSVQHVKDAFNGTVHEFIEVENDPDLREVQSFLPLYERVETINPNSVCLWAHAKGVTSEAERPNSVPIWRELLYELYLDYWSLVEEQLKEHPITGAFYKTGLPDAWKGHTNSDWHYSGSWWWFRCSELFGQKDWRTIERFKYGIEPYPSLHFSKQQAGCLFFRGEYPTLELYSEKYLKEVVLPAYRVWKRDHIHHRTHTTNR